MRKKYVAFGLFASAVIALVSAAAWYLFLIASAFGGCKTFIACQAIGIFLLVSIVSVVAALVFLIKLIRGPEDSRRALVIYLAIVGFFAVLGFSLSSYGPINMVLTNTPAECKLFSFFEDRDRCWNRQAFVQKDMSICYNIKIKDERPAYVSYEPRAQCVATFATEAQDPNMCLKGDNRCVAHIAGELADPKLCEMIEVLHYTSNIGTQEDSRSQCYEMAKNIMWQNGYR